jgi:hypothetical protein
MSERKLSSDQLQSVICVAIQARLNRGQGSGVKDLRLNTSASKD